MSPGLNTSRVVGAKQYVERSAVLPDTVSQLERRETSYQSHLQNPDDASDTQQC